MKKADWHLPMNTQDATDLQSDLPLVDALYRLLNAQTVEVAWAVHTAEMARFGFDRLFYGFTRFHTAQGLGSRDDMLVLSNHSNDYLDRYLGEEMYVVAPMTQWARDNVGFKSWSWIAERKSRLSAAETRVLEFNQSHAVTAGYTISFPDATTRNKGAIALTARRGMSQCDVEQVWARHGREINVMNQVAHLKFTSLPLPLSQPRLSQRQREVLEWVGDGKTMQDIATIMGLKAATVEKHLKKARDALDVETSAQAVMKASLQKQIFVMDT